MGSSQMNQMKTRPKKILKTIKISSKIGDIKDTLGDMATSELHKTEGQRSKSFIISDLEAAILPLFWVESIEEDVSQFWWDDREQGTLRKFQKMKIKKDFKNNQKLKDVIQHLHDSVYNGLIKTDGKHSGYSLNSITNAALFPFDIERIATDCVDHYDFFFSDHVGKF